MSELERDEFEKFARKHLRCDGPFLRDCNEIDATRTYQDFDIEAAWIDWQAAKASAGVVGWQKIIPQLLIDGQIADVWAVFERGPRRVKDAIWSKATGEWVLGQYSESQYELRPKVTHILEIPAAPRDNDGEM